MNPMVPNLNSNQRNTLASINENIFETVRSNAIKNSSISNTSSNIQTTAKSTPNNQHNISYLSTSNIQSHAQTFPSQPMETTALQRPTTQQGSGVIFNTPFLMNNVSYQRYQANQMQPHPLQTNQNIVASSPMSNIASVKKSLQETFPSPAQNQT